MIRLFSMGSVLFLGACATHPDSNTSRQYNCTDNRQLIASFDETRENAGVTFEGRSKNLSLRSIKNGRNYSDGVVTLKVKDETLTLIDDGFPIYTDCIKAK